MHIPRGGLEVRDRIGKGSWEVRRLDKLARVFVGSRFARTYSFDQSRAVPYLTGSDMLLADFKDLLYLSVAKTPQLIELQVRPGWTLMSCSGTIGRTVYVREEMSRMAVSHDVMRVAPYESDIRPGYLFAFLSSAPALSMIRQAVYGSVIQHIEPSHLFDLPVPIPDDARQFRINSLISCAASARTQATVLLDRASGYFDRLAGNFDFSHYHEHALNIVQRSGLRGRLDAFHHIGWAAEPREAGEELQSIARVWSVSSMKRVWAERGIPFGSGSNMFTLRPSPERLIARWAADEVQAYVKTGDILVQAYGQLEGLIGRPVFVGSRLNGWAIGHLMVRIRPKQSLQRGRIFSFFRSDAGRRATVRLSSGNQIPHFTANAIQSVRIPEIPSDLAEQTNYAIELRERADMYEASGIQEVESWLA